MISKFIRSLKKINNRKKFFLENSRNLLPGKYLFSDSLKYAYLNEKATKKHLYSLFDNDPLITFNYKLFIVKQLFFSRGMQVENTGSLKNKFTGNIYFFSNNHEEDKIFDIENKKVLLIFQEWDYYNENLKNYKQFNQYFNLPQKIIYREKEKMLIEELISFKDNWSDEDSNMVLKQSFNKYIKYFQAKKDKKEYVKPKELLKNIKNDYYRSMFEKVISKELFEIDFSIQRLHGDLRKNNILLEKVSNEIYYIDWELNGNYFVFYDLFFLMYHEAILSKKPLLLQSYLSGSYDSYFERIFNIFDMKYQRAKRVDYLFIFLLEHFIKKGKQKPEIYDYYIILYNKYIK